MATDCKAMVDSYLKWLREKTVVVDLNGVCEITTPFLDRHNDRIQIFAVPTDDGIRLTDDGYILGDLKSSGCAIETPTRKSMLDVILNGFGVRSSGEELFIDTSADKFPASKHALLQAMLSVGDMFMTTRQHISALFWEDVAKFMEENNIRSIQDVEFVGKSGLRHKFDFVIPKSSKRPERLLRTINNPTTEAARIVLFTWTDTKDMRSKGAEFYVVLNDNEKEIGRDIISAFAEYKVNVIPWRKRMDYVPALVA